MTQKTTIVLDSAQAYCDYGALMKLSAKNASTLIGLGMLGAVVGGLAWEVVERICIRFGMALEMSIGPIGFDLSVISLHFMVNPGTFIGLCAGVLLFHFL